MDIDTVMMKHIKPFNIYQTIGIQPIPKTVLRLTSVYFPKCVVTWIYRLITGPNC